MNKYILLTLTLFLSVSTLGTASAVVDSHFSSCGNPEGSLIVSYDKGVHGIVGNSLSYTGADKVYKLSNGNIMQCFCGTNGEGIQTNWIKNIGFSENEIAILQKNGWMVVPNGSLWGLDSAQYFARNTSFACMGTSTGANGNSSLTSGTSNSSAGQAGKSVLGASTGLISALANTGNALLFYSTLFLGITLLIIGLLLPQEKSNKKSK